MYYIVSKGGTLKETFEGNYSEALDRAAELFEIPSCGYVSDYADVLTEDEYAEEYGDDREEDDDE